MLPRGFPRAFWSSFPFLKRTINSSVTTAVHVASSWDMIFNQNPQQEDPLFFGPRSDEARPSGES